MIIVKDLHKEFENNHVLRGVNYHVHQGEKIVIVGPSGSGKSTFLRCLNLLETPTSGEIRFDGQLITDPKVNIDKVREHMGMVFQNFNLFNNLSIMDNITRHDHGGGNPRDGLCQGSGNQGAVYGRRHYHGGKYAGRILRKPEMRQTERFSV